MPTTRNHKRAFGSMLVFLSGVLLLMLVVYAKPAPQQSETAQSQLETCAACHEEQVKNFAANKHAAIDAKEQYKKANAEFSCTSCHGDASKHLEQGGGKGTIFAFGDKETATTKSKACLACHSDNHPGYFASNHAKAGMSCTSCHGVHGEKQGETAACASCHADVAAKFKLNEHHRLKEGILECTSCHNPHEAATRERLGGFKNEACFKCHTDKQGPFVYEHGANFEEGCTACHEPHGSTNRHMLSFQRVADLCRSCHASFPHATSYTQDSQCTACHVTMHGSNVSSTFRK